jgi:hypothetical protein
MALVDGRYDDAFKLFEDAVALLSVTGEEPEVAGLAVKIGHALRRAGRATEAIDRMRQGLAVLSREAGDSGAAELNVELAVALLASGYVREAAEPLDRGLELAQAHELTNVLAGALTYRAQMCVMLGRSHEASLLFDGAIDLCRQYELTSRLIVALLNSGDFLRRFDLPGAAERLSDALVVARQAGSRVYESVAASSLMLVWHYTGEWDELEQLGNELLEGQSRERPGAEYLHLGLTLLSAHRGELGSAREHLAGMSAWRSIEANEARWSHAASEAWVALAAGDHPTALELLSGTMSDVIAGEGASNQASRIGFPCALEAAIELGQMDQAAELMALLGDLPPGHVPPFLRAQVARGRGLLALAADDRAAAHGHLIRAVEMLSTLGYPFWLARARTDLGALLIDDGRFEEGRRQVGEAIAVLRPLRAAPALERAESLLARLGVAAGSTP